MAETARNLMPVLEGERVVYPNPTDLGELQGEIIPETDFKGQEVVDHHTWRDTEGDKH